jgi:hypothetical protein
MYPYARWKQILKKCFAPIQMFKKISDTEYIAVVPLPGVKPSDVLIQWECNQQISVNTYFIKKISVCSLDYQYPLYHHVLLAPPHGTSNLNQFRQTWDHGLLILSYQRETLKK